MKKVPFWLKFGLASALIVYISAVFTEYLFYSSFGADSDSGGFFANIHLFLFRPLFQGQYIFLVSLIVIFAIGSLIGKIINKGHREYVKNLFNKYRNSSYLPFLVLIMFQTLLEVFRWIGETDQISYFFGLLENSNYLFVSIFFVYGAVLFYLFSKLLMVGILYSGIYQIKNGFKNKGIISIVIFILTFLLSSLLF